VLAVGLREKIRSSYIEKEAGEKTKIYYQQMIWNSKK
jgi:hypothetical protein